MMAWVFLDESTRRAAHEGWSRFWIDVYGEQAVGSTVLGWTGDAFDKEALASTRKFVPSRT